MLSTSLLFLSGGALLILGAELLVRGASRLAAFSGVSPLVIGLTVVAFGTSSPELAVTAESALGGQSEIALGNVVGSNIFNILFILGLSALVAPLTVAAQLVRRDVPLMAAVSVFAFALAWDGRIDRLDGSLLAIGIVLYTGFLIRQSWNQPVEPGGRSPRPESRTAWLRHAASAAVGLVMLTIGSRWFVEAAAATAAALDVSPLVVGLTIVAAGTSLPELATSVLASLRGERDIAVGNVVGSNIFNLSAVLGVGGVLAPDGVAVSANALTLDLPVMIAASVAALPVFFTGYRISRWEGAVFLGYYAAYTAYLVMQASGRGPLPDVGVAALWLAGSITVLTLAVVVRRSLREK